MIAYIAFNAYKDKVSCNLIDDGGNNLTTLTMSRSLKPFFIIISTRSSSNL